MTRIVVDAMGSDNYPTPDVEGALMAAREYGVEIILVGELQRYSRCLIRQCSESAHTRDPCARNADYA